MVFAVALLLAFVQMGAVRTQAQASSADQTHTDKTPESLRSESAKVTQMKVTREKLTGEGQRLGTAYRLKSGQVVYIPDAESTARPIVAPGR